MFDASTYIDRRTDLAGRLGSGIALFLGNDESAMNYRGNPYPFRQDSSFLYYWGLSGPGLAGVLDVDEDRSLLFGKDPTIEDMVWEGPLPRLADRGALSGVSETRSVAALADTLARAAGKGRHIHFLPQYRAETQAKLEGLLFLKPATATEMVSAQLTRAVIEQRLEKEPQEIAEINRALDVSYDMHTYAMRTARPGHIEREVAGAVEGIANAGGGRLAFPIIFSRHGEILHNHSYNNELLEGDLVVLDSGASSPKGYASDITRSIPVSGTFTERQKAIYQLVLDAQLRAIDAMKPGVSFKDIHLLAARSIAADLKALGLMKGDTDDAVAAGAHALFFPHGLGHHMGLDVHDLEGLGEDLVGYDDETQRSPQFGLCYLRMGRRLKPGYVLTVEPGCYFIGPLIDHWKAEGRHTEFINYEALKAWRGFGGVRIEDDVLVTDDGHLVLGKPIPKSVALVEAACAR